MGVRGSWLRLAARTRRPDLARPDWAVYALILFFSLVQQVGRTTLDTRVELSERPTSFLAGGFSLWHGSTNFGELLNQAYGYLFPQGPFFVLVELSGMPPWVGQRLWCALVLLVAYEGARRCARVLGFEGRRRLAGRPRLHVQPATARARSASSAPRPARCGAAVGRAADPAVRPRALGPVRAAVLSGAAVVCMGGVNAVEVIGSLPMPLLVAVLGDLAAPGAGPLPARGGAARSPWPAPGGCCRCSPWAGSARPSTSTSRARATPPV